MIKVIYISSRAARHFGTLPLLAERTNPGLLTKELLIFQDLTGGQDLSLLKKGRTLLSQRTLRYDRVTPFRSLAFLYPGKLSQLLKIPSLAIERL